MPLQSAVTVSFPCARLPAVLGIALTSVFCTSAAFSQTGSTAASGSDLEEVTVVGSHLPQTIHASSITVVTQDLIQQRGYSTVQQALDGLAQNSGGGIDQQLGIASFTPAAAAVNLRDLGVGRALILLDGRRLPMYPVGFNGTDSFVDISSIPVGAIDRIEVLTQGASAIYGSDALSGVINIVLKKQPVNEVSVYRSGTTQGGGDEQRWQLSTGAANDTSSALFTAEYYQRNPLGWSQRERSRSVRLGGVTGSGPGSFSFFGYPGTYTNANENAFTPAASCAVNDITPVIASGICQFNGAYYRQLWPDSNSLSAMARLTQKLSASTELFLDVLLRNGTTNTQFEPQDLDVRYDLGVSDISASVPGTPYGATGSYWRRLVELGPRTKDFSTNSYTAVAGAKGEWANRWNWELSLQSSRQKVVEADGGLALVSDWRAAINRQRDFNGDGVNDTLNLTQLIPDYIAQQLGYTAISNSSSNLSTAQWLLSGELMQLTHGPLRLATVAEYSRERYYDRHDPQILSGNVVFTTATNGAGNRARSAVGVEVQWPLLTSLQLNLAGRYDKYQDASDVGGAFSPRVTLQFEPLASWQWRASVGRDFRAPDLQRLFGGNVSSSTTLINTPRCKANGGSGRGDISVASCVSTVRAGVTTRANRDLTEEHGTHYSLGTSWQPMTNWSVSLDYFLIDLKDLVQRPDLQYVLDENAANGSYASWIIASGTQGCSTAAAFCLDMRPINIAYKKTSGLDLQLDGKLPTSVGEFSLGVTANYLLDVTMRESAVRPPVDVLKSGQLGEAVRFMGGVDLGWALNSWRSHIYLNHMGSFTPLLTTIQSRIGSFTTVNANVSRTLLTRTTLQVGVNNIFNREPPIATYQGSTSAPFYHQQFHNLDGATWVASVRQGF